MILPFKTQINGMPTYFVEKIWASLHFSNFRLEHFDRRYYEIYKESPFDFETEFIPKFHTIREDKTNRWQVGKMIDFYINNQTKKAFCFAPRVPVIAVQNIEIHWYGESRELTPSQAGDGEFYNYVEVVINSNSDDYRLLTIKEVEQLALNDGFDSVEDFFAYFNNNLKGKIIHWTNFKY